MKTPTDEQLLADHLRNRPDAFELLVRRHSEELYRFALRFTNNSMAAEDVVQETLLQVYRSAASFDAARRFKPWLFTIAANKARDWLRGRSRHMAVSLDAQIDGGDEHGEKTFLDLLATDTADRGDELEFEEKRRIVRGVVDQMPATLREALVLAYYHRFAYKEISEVLDIPVGTVKSRLHAAVGFFGKMYQGQALEAMDQ
ncbi:MAG: sigma-70 family RNA polymerase sigma factor [Phycisphaerae bacterium]